MKRSSQKKIGYPAGCRTRIYDTQEAAHQAALEFAPGRRIDGTTAYEGRKRVVVIPKGAEVQ